MKYLSKIIINILKPQYFFIQSKIFNIKYHKLLRITGYLYITGRGSIEIGNNVVFNSGRHSNPLGGETKISLIASKGSKLHIGNGCKISNSVIFCTTSITIEDDVFIGNNVKIYDSDFHPILPTERLQNLKPISKPVIIRKNTFIGAHSIILKGVTIGENSVIGAGSVVTKNVPENEIWAGNPARFIKKIYE